MSSGMRCAETTRASWAMPNSARISVACAGSPSRCWSPSPRRPPRGAAHERSLRGSLQEALNCRRRGFTSPCHARRPDLSATRRHERHHPPELRSRPHQRLARSSRCCSTSGRPGAARARRSARCWRSSRSPTPAASSWPSSTPTRSPRSPASCARCSACAASRSACCSRAASRSTASSARCPRRRCAQFLDKHVPSADEHAAEDEVARGRGADRRGRHRGRARPAAGGRGHRPGQRRRALRLRASCCSTAGRVAEARAAPSTRSPARPLLDARLDAAGHWLAAHCEAAAGARSAEALAAAIAANKRDFDARFELAQSHFAAQRASPRRWTSCSRS